MSRRRTRQSVPDEAHHDHLSGLPPELLELISECLSARDLLSWRLTCRATAACSTRPFDRKYIAERAHFLLDEDSMLHLADLISDEERRRHLKTIHLSLAELLSPDADHRSRRVGAEVLGLDKGRGHRAKRRDQRALHTSLWNRLATGGRDRCAKMLERCLRSLSSLRTEVGLSVTDVGFKVHRRPVAMNSHPENPPAWGYESLCEKLGYREPLAKSQCDDGAWTVLFQAVRAAGFTPSTLELGNVWNGVPIDRMNKLWLKPSLRFEPFQQLTDLRLCLSLGFGSVLGLYEDARKTQLSQTKSF